VRTHARQLLILAAAASLAPALADDSVEIRRVESRLEQLQEQFGPYSPALSEPTAELGSMLIRSGAHADARKAFRRAMHIERVNAGLYTPSQLPFLDMAIESSVAARDWDQVDDDFRYLEWLNYRIHGQRDPALIEGLTRIINWHLAAIHLDRETEKGEHLLQLLKLGEHRAALAESHYGKGHPQHLEQVYQLALYLYYIHVAARPAGPVSEVLIEKLTSPIDQRRSYYLAQEQLTDDCYRKGRALLETGLEGARGTAAFGTEASAIALVYLADWELMFNHRNRAEKLYGEAFAMLTADGASAGALNELFGAPALLPEPRFRLVARNSAVADAGQSASAIKFVPWAREVPGVQFPVVAEPGVSAVSADRYALARFHVEENGWTENIRIIEVRPRDGGLSRDARKAIWHAQFRPRLEDGRIAVTRDVEVRYLPPE
jgi:hypothetical protein